MAKNIESLFNELDSIKASLEDVLTSAQNVINTSNEFGGEISRVIGEQMTKYFIPSLDKLVRDENTPGSVFGVMRFLNSCPLAFTRETPSIDNSASPVIEQSNIIEPMGTSEESESMDKDIEELPTNASYAHPQGVEEGHTVEESTQKRSGLKIVRESVKGNTKQFVANVENLINSYIEDKDYSETDPNWDAWDGMESEIMSMANYMPYHSISLAIKNWVQGGSMACYTNQILDDLAEIYENTPEEKEKWSHLDSDKLWERYFNVMAMYLPKAFKLHKGREFGKKLNESSVEGYKSSHRIVESEKFTVVRTSNMESPLGEVANLKGSVVAEFDNEEDANARCEELNKTVRAEEAEAFGTCYKVEKEPILVD